MFFWLKHLGGILHALNEDTSPNEIAAGFAIGAMFGLIPKSGLLLFLFWFLFWTLRINKAMAAAALLLFAIAGQITDPLAEQLGYWILTGIAPLQGLFTALYNMPIIPFTGFNQTMVMGNAALGVLLFGPLFWGVRRLVPVYRERYRERILQSKVMRFFKVNQWAALIERWRNS